MDMWRGLSMSQQQISVFYFWSLSGRLAHGIYGAIKQNKGNKQIIHILSIVISPISVFSPLSWVVPLLHSLCWYLVYCSTLLLDLPDLLGLRQLWQHCTGETVCVIRIMYTSVYTPRRPAGTRAWPGCTSTCVTLPSLRSL